MGLQLDGYLVEYYDGPWVDRRYAGSVLIEDYDAAVQEVNDKSAVYTQVTMRNIYSLH